MGQVNAGLDTPAGRRVAAAAAALLRPCCGFRPKPLTAPRPPGAELRGAALCASEFWAFITSHSDSIRDYLLTDSS